MFRPILEMFNCTEPTFIILYSFEKEGRNVNSISIRYILYIFFSICVRRFFSNGLTIGMVPFGFCRLYSPVSPVTKFFVFVFYTIFFFLLKIQFLRMFVDYSGADWAIGMKRFSFCVSKICPVCSLLNIVTANYILFADYITLHYFAHFIKLGSFFKPCPLLLTPCFKHTCVISLHIGRKKYDS